MALDRTHRITRFMMVGALVPGALVPGAVSDLVARARLGKQSHGSSVGVSPARESTRCG